MQCVLSERDPKAGQKHCMLENAAIAGDCERNGLLLLSLLLTLNQAPFPSGTLIASPGKVSYCWLFLPGILMIPGVRVCALGLHRGSQHHAVHGHIHLPQGLFHHGCH